MALDHEARRVGRAVESRAGQDRAAWPMQVAFARLVSAGVEGWAGED